MSSDLRILHIVPSFHVGGAEQMVGHLAAGLSASHEVMVAGLYPASDSSIERKLRQTSVQLRHLDKRSGFDPSMFFAMHRVFREFRPHIVHTHLSVLRYALPGLLTDHATPVIHTLHSVAERENDAFGRVLQSMAFRRRVIPVSISSEVAASFKRTYGFECDAIVPNCIPVDKFVADAGRRGQWRQQEGIEQDALVFVSVGRLAPVKNQALLLKAFAELNHPCAHLLVIGEGRLKTELIEMVGQLSLQYKVRILGGRNDIPAALAASDVFVLSSDWEGSPLSVLEAMAAGLPVISTAVGGVPELVRPPENGLLVPAGDQRSLTEAMRLLGGNDEWRVKLGRAAYAYVRDHFSLQRMVHGYRAIYDAALSPGEAASPVSMASPISK